MTQFDIAAQGGSSARRLGGWVAVVGTVAVVVPLPLWLFWSNVDQRRWTIAACMAAALACAVAVLAYQKSVGRHGFAAALAAVRPAGGGADAFDAGIEPPLPGRLPSKRTLQVRGAAAVFCGVTAVVAFVALAAGAAVRPEPVESIHTAGAVITDVEVTKVSGSVRHDPSRGHDYYTATSVVALPNQRTGRKESATVATSTDAELRPGSRVTVLYAPSDPGLGAVQGDPVDLRRSLSGLTLSRGHAQIALIAWVLIGGFLAAYNLVESGGLRGYAAFSRRDRALRGRCVGSDTSGARSGEGRSAGEASQQCLLIETTAGSAHFQVDVSSKAVAENIGAEPVWLAWDAERGEKASRFTPKTTPAVLVGDSGWLLYGRMVIQKAQLLNEAAAVPGGPAAPVDERRRTRLWDPRSSWPLRTGPTGLVALGLAAVCAGVLALYAVDGWRWWIAAGGIGCIFTAVATYTMALAGDENNEKAVAPQG
ncbi:hypothetical protein [Streptomyces sp. 8N706]|uniref:hypothetical protein n=1 Tax=Streptomyces sp. 8N706 TaxID=3457416 RepID=UPI003FD37849